LPLGSPWQSFLYNFRFDDVGNGTLSNVHHRNMLLVINMDVAGDAWAMPTPHKRNRSVVM